jgi:hypothetical protein
MKRYDKLDFPVLVPDGRIRLGWLTGDLFRA